MEDLFAVDDAQVNSISRGPNNSNDNPIELERHSVPISARETLTRRYDPTLDADFSFERVNAESQGHQGQSSPPTQTPINLGLDEEVTVKRRKPAVKLDEERLLSEKGISRLRAISKNLSFRGKGHEIRDLGKLIEFYQFWAHDLHPKAKFRDVIKMANKLGKTKRMKICRRQWIDDSLPKDNVASDNESERDLTDFSTEHRSEKADGFSLPKNQDDVEDDLYGDDVDDPEFDLATQNPNRGLGQSRVSDIDDDATPPHTVLHDANGIGYDENEANDALEALRGLD